MLPNPVTWSPGTQIKAPQLRADVSDAVQLLTGPPFFAGANTQTAQTPGDSSNTPVQIDTEFADPWAGHHNNAGSTYAPRWYAPFAGHYLVRVSVPFASTGPGSCSAGVQRVSGGGSPASYFGQRVPNQAGANSNPSVIKILSMVNIGSSWGSGDWIAPTCYQDSGSGLALVETTNRYPNITIQWIGALSGTQPLPVPANDAWAVPPAWITSAFMNSNVRDTINYLCYPPVMEWQYNNGTNNLASATSLPATGTTIGLDAQNFDNYSAFSNGSNTWTAPVAGIYLAYGQLALTGDSSSVSLAAGLTVNSDNYNGGSAFTFWSGAQVAYVSSPYISCVVTNRRLRLNAGDTLKLAGWQRNSSGNAATIQGNSTQWTTRFGAVWQGA